jgi:hypothetical protein
MPAQPHTVAIPIWVKHGIDLSTTVAGIEDGRVPRSVSKSGKVNRDTLSDWSVGAHDLPAPAPSSAGKWR